MKFWKWLLLVFIVSSNYFNLRIFVNLQNYDLSIIINALLILYGFMHYKKGTFINTQNYNWFFWLMTVSMILSCISVVIFHEQRILDSIMVYRSQIFLLYLPLLFYIQPPICEIRKAVIIYTTTFIILLYISLAIPSIFNKMNFENSLETTDLPFLVKSNGLLWNMMFFFLLPESFKKITKYNLILIMLFLLTVILIQNRQTIIYISIITLYTIFKIKSKIYIKWIILLGCVIIIARTSYIFDFLINETKQDTQIDGGRAISLPYFIYDHNPNIIVDFIGNGMDSKKSAYGRYLTELGKNYAIWSGDLGIVGVWSIYGLLPVFAIGLLVVKILKQRKNMPYFVTYIASSLFLCPFLLSITESNFLWWALLMYFYAYFETCNKRGIKSIFL